MYIKLSDEIDEIDDVDAIKAEKYTGYNSEMKKFNHNGVTVGQVYLNQYGDDFNGFFAKIDGILSNGIKFKWSHNIKGEGIFNAVTKKGTLIFEENINLTEAGMGHGTYLVSYLNSILDFNF